MTYFTGKEHTYTESSVGYTETHTGTYDALVELGGTYATKTFYDGKGWLTEKTLSQEEGPNWKLTLTYTTEISDDGTDENTSSGAQNNSLGTTTLSMPLETHPSYKTCWNYYLIRFRGVLKNTTYMVVYCH